MPVGVFAHEEMKVNLIHIRLAGLCFGGGNVGLSGKGTLCREVAFSVMSEMRF